MSISRRAFCGAGVAAPFVRPALAWRHGAIFSAPVSWAAAWTLGTGQVPSAVLNFINTQYFDGSNDAAALSSMVQNSPTVTPGSGMLCNANNFSCIGSLLSGLNSVAATAVITTFSCPNAQTLGVMDFTTGTGAPGAPDTPFIGTTTPTMDAWNNSTIQGPTSSSTGFTIDFTAVNTFATAWNASNISVATGNVVNTAAKHFANPVTGAHLGSFAGSFLLTGYIQYLAVYPIAVSAQYLRSMTWHGKWNFPFNGATGLGQFNGEIDVPTLSSYFKSNTPWSMVCGSNTQSGSSAAIKVLFTNVSNSGTPPWYGHEVYINSNFKLRTSIFSGWAGGAASTNLIQVEGSTVLNDNNWHSIGVTYDGSSTAAGVKMYVDGVAETLTTTFDNLTGASDTNVGVFEIGGQFGGFHVDFIDFFSMSNIARSAGYFSSILATRTRPAVDANTILYYDFREGSGTTTADRSSNGYNGTFTASIPWL